MSFVSPLRRTALAAGLAVSFVTTAAAVDIPIPAKVQLVKQDKKAGFVGKLAKLLSKPAAPVAINGNPSVSGAYLRFFQTGAPQAWSSIALPAAGWSAIGSGGFKYKGAGDATDPCKTVLLKDNLIKALCKGSGSTDSPAPYAIPVSGGAAFELVIGADRYCAESSAGTGAVIKKDGDGLFLAKDAGAPGSCAEAIPATCSSAAITVQTSFTPPAKDVQGVATTVVYVGPKLQLNGSPTNLTGIEDGIFSFGDNDLVGGDFLNDTLTVGLVASPGDIPPGLFASASFVCRDGASSPTPNDFSCSSDVSDVDGGAVASACSISLAVTP
jgi:hypothetical protein